MQVIPSINEQAFEGVLQRVRKAEDFLLQSEAGAAISPVDEIGWIHFDVADGIFSSHVTWNAPEDLLRLETSLNIEVHLMVQEPEQVLRQWLQSLVHAAKHQMRIIVHVESMTDPSYIIEECKNFGVMPGLALNPMTAADLVLLYVRAFPLVQILAVNPGPGGQLFQELVLPKIRLLKEKHPNVIIEVDGGINPSTALMVKNAGADIIVVGSYIFGHPVPKVAYEELARI